LTYPRVLAVGDAAVTVELGTTIDPDLARRVRALDRALLHKPFRGYREAVPTYRSLLVTYDPARIRFADVRADLLARAAAPEAPEEPGRLHRVPVVYGGEAGPDLAEVARALALSEAEVVAQHTSIEYTAFMLGFRPGFAYLGVLPESLALPRLATPRVRVPAGSVGIAGRQTGIYPVVSPGGWRLLGRTTFATYDPFGDPPSVVAPGDRVRFEPVDTLDDPAPRRVTTHAGPPALEVLEPGLLTTVQDLGRHGQRRFGVAQSGAVDTAAHAAANARLGNEPGAAALECSMAGPSLRFLRVMRFAIEGADLGAVLRRADLGDWAVPLGTPVLARPGNVLIFGERRAGARASVAFAGGIEVPVVAGSRATDLASGFGGFEGRALRSGDLLSVGLPREPRAEAGWKPPDARAVVRVVLGPQYDLFPPGEVERFLRETFRVGPTSDRTGCRLEGARLAARESEITSDGMVPGSVQVPPDGKPIVMLADGPTTGGYPKIATVVATDLPRLAQLVPGEGEVRFSAVSVEDAQRGSASPGLDGGTKDR
jgi:KipI family sensor histidine kinase inhibitor